jgi:hypothetical protein
MTSAFSNSSVEIYVKVVIITRSFNGRVAEWPIAAVLKTAVGQPTVGSNPTSSDQNAQGALWAPFAFLSQEERANCLARVRYSK